MKVEGKTYLNETIHVDFNEFVNCKFLKCSLIYHGFGPVGMVGCAFTDVKWIFADAASNTLNFLRSLYFGGGEGGKALIESTFASIKSNKIPHTPPTL